MAKAKVLHVFLAGEFIGELEERSDGKHQFTYVFSDGKTPTQLSLSMPVRAQPWTGAAVESYIDGVLPDDRAIRERIARVHGVNARNPFALLTAIGLDCGGAVQFVSDENLPLLAQGGKYEMITEQEIGDRLRALMSGQPSWQNPEEHWSLNGAQDKLALAYFDDQWHEAQGAAATTHILKPGIYRLHEQAFNEFVCLRTISALELPTAHTIYRAFDGTPALVSERWDRIILQDIAGETAVERIHQEDMCQALAIPTDRKYQSDGGPSAIDVVRLLRTNNFVETDVLLFFSALVLNYLIGGSDAHAKNFAIIERRDARPRLAPLYDIASVFPYQQGRRHSEVRLAMSIGGKYRFDQIGLQQWRKFAQRCGGSFDIDVIEMVLKNYATRLPEALDTVTQDESMKHLLALETEESALNKQRIIQEITSGTQQQCEKVLSWFS